MATTYLTGSYAAAQDLTTVVIINSTLEGTGGLQEEVTDLFGAGYRIVGSIFWDGTNYNAMMLQKSKIAF